MKKTFKKKGQVLLYLDLVEAKTYLLNGLMEKTFETLGPSMPDRSDLSSTFAAAWTPHVRLLDPATPRFRLPLAPGGPPVLASAVFIVAAPVATTRVARPGVPSGSAQGDSAPRLA